MCEDDDVGSGDREPGDRRSGEIESGESGKPAASLPAQADGLQAGDDDDHSRNVLALEAFLPYRLNRVSEIISRSFARIYSDQYGMSRPDWRVIAILGQFGRVTAKTVGERSTMHKTKVSRAVSTLEKRGFLIRTPNSEDMREIFLELTPTGQEAYDALVPQALAFSNHLMNSLPADQHAQLEIILEQLVASVSNFKA